MIGLGLVGLITGLAGFSIPLIISITPTTLALLFLKCEIILLLLIKGFFNYSLLILNKIKVRVILIL